MFFGKKHVFLLDKPIYNISNYIKTTMIKVIKFSAVWCGPCRALKPIFDQVRSQISDVVYQEIDVDNDPAATIKYNVSSVPTIIIERGGQEVHRTKGNMTAAALATVINSNK